MKNVPYHDNPGNACALACYTMIAQYLLPDAHITFEQLSKVGNWREGYVVWEFPIWKWLMDRGVYITDYDVIDYDAWSKEGVSGLQNSLPSDEFNWYKENTYDLEEVTGHIQQAFAHPNFSYTHRKPTWEDLLAEHEKAGICDVVLNSHILNQKEGFAAHRVVLIDISDKEVIFHDPNFDGSGKYRHEPINRFRQAFEHIESPALARYRLQP
ncbi:MAG TPA: hypothetical protein VLF59_02470 [Candidatus Saccharimonadales bacterium]|nr:hypothetical protein [Candidatus Saccharimonadales bacterium]